MQDFLNNLRTLKYSECSITSYGNALKVFFSFMERNAIARMQDVTIEDLENYKAGLIEKEYADSTLDIYTRTLKLYFKFLEDRGEIFINPAEGMRKHKRTMKMQYVPNPEDMKRLLELPDTSSAIGIRDRAIIETAYSTACRIQELSNLTLHDIDLKNAMMVIRQGKGNKDRIVPIGRHAVKWLNEYLTRAREELLAGSYDEDTLWIGFHHRKITSPAIHKMLETYSRILNISPVITVHSIRRLAATQMLNNGASPALIAEMLGHADLGTLYAYLKVTAKEIKEMHSRAKVGE